MFLKHLSVEAITEKAFRRKNLQTVVTSRESAKQSGLVPELIGMSFKRLSL